MASSAIVISILANASQANAQLQTTASRAEKVGNGFRKMRGPAVLALAGIAAGAKAAIDSASDLQEAISKNTQIFGDQSAEIEKFAAGAAKSLGQSKSAALDAAATFGTVASSAGLSGGAAADFSKQFVTLSSDLASFNNTSPEEAVTAIGAAMRGESEPIRKYGVLLDDATLRNRALKEGLIDNVKTALTPQQKALAASKEILAQTTKAQGDFGRTSKGAANQSRIQAAETENLKAKLGQNLLPVYEDIQRAVLKFGEVLSKNGTAVKIAVGIIAGLAVAVLAVNAALAVAGAAVTIYSAIITVLGTIIKAVRLAQILLNIAFILNPIGVVVIAIIALIAIFVVLYKRSETVRNVINAVFNGIKSVVIRVVTAVVNFVKNVWAKIVGFFSGPVRTAAGKIASAFNTIKAGIQRFVSAAKEKVSNFISDVKAIPGRIKRGLGNVGQMLYSAGRSIIAGLAKGVTDRLSALYDKVKGIGDKIKSLKGPLSYDKVMLLEEGKAIIGGLIKGIASQEKPLYRRVAAISGTLAGTKLAVLGSDVAASKEDEGKAMVAGLIKGIESQESKLYRRVDGISRKLGETEFSVGSAALTANAPARMEISGRGARERPTTVNINVKVAPGSDRRAIGREVADSLRAYYQSGGRVVTP